MGVTQVSTVLMVLGVCLEMNEDERQVSTSLMIEGFRDCAKEAGTSVTGGQSIMSPWPIIGGVGIVGLPNEHFKMPIHAQPGDQLVLTKPLGIQIAVNVYQWLKNKSIQWDKVKHLTNEMEVTEAYNQAEISMATLNLEGAKLLMQYQAKATTDVTGFGIIGHANYLALAQKNKKCRFRINTLPIIKNMFKLDKIARDFKMKEGMAAETSGGLLMAIPEDQLDSFLKIKGGWHIGEVVEGENGAEIAKNCQILEV